MSTGGDRAPRNEHSSARALFWVVIAYAAVAAVGFGIAALRGQPNVFMLPLDVADAYGGKPNASLRLGGSDWEAHLTSLAGGLGLAVAVIGATRWLVRTQTWAEALHEDLRPMARALGTEAIIPVALASSFGEEVLFRGALVPALGVVASSILFGALHQMRGRSRLSWVAFAVVVGMMLGFLFRATGSLIGPIVAHAVINAVNLRFLITHAPGRRGDLGGLLRR